MPEKKFPCKDTFDPNHIVNWYVYRSNDIRKKMQQLWGRGPANPALMETPAHKIFRRNNILFRNMEKYGPCNNGFEIIHDKQKDLYHCHVTDGRGNTYLALWMVDEEKKIISIVNIDYHENFDFGKKLNRERLMAEARLAKDTDPKYKQHLVFLETKEEHSPAPMNIA